MSTKVFKFLSDYVAVYTKQGIVTGSFEVPFTFATEKMSYKDFYTMLQDLHEDVVPAKVVGTSDLEFKENYLDKYTLLMDKLNYKRLPLNIKQYSLQEDELILTLQFGSEKHYFMDRVFDDTIEYVNKPLDNRSVYIVVLSVGFTRRVTEKSVARPNKLTCLSVHRKNIIIKNKKPKFELEEIPYLKGKLTAYLDETINNKKGSKIKLVKDTLLNQELDVESVLRLVTEKELSNIKFSTRMQKSILERKPIDWKGLTYK